MSTDVYFNDFILELKSSKGIAVTFQIGSVFNPNNRAGNATNKFKVPKTKDNTEKLGFLLNLNSATNIPYQKNSAKIIQNGIEIVSDGFAIVDSTGRDYALTIYSGNVSFFDRIKGKNMNELDLDSSIHEYDIPTIIASFTSSFEFIYGMVDWGNGVQLLPNSTLINSNALMPMLRYARALEKITSESGYELKGTFLDNPVYERLLLCPNQFGYLQEKIDQVTGVADDVVALGPFVILVQSICNFGAATDLFQVVPLLMQNIVGPLFAQNLIGPTFTPDNYYLGTFNLFAQGDVHSTHIPKKGESVLQSGTGFNDFRESWINDSHASWVCRTQGFSDINLFVKALDGLSAPHLAASSGFATGGVTSMTETNGGYIAYSFNVSGLTDVNLYNITTQTTTQIYLNPTGVNEVNFLKIWNGKVMWLDATVFGGGLFVYDILTATTKQVNVGNITGQLDGNGDYLVWEDFVANDINIFSFATGLSTLIENGGAFSGMNTCHVLGDYATYWDTSLDKMVSYKISTGTKVDIIQDNTKTVSGSARTPTALGFSYTNGQLFYYDLLTDTLTTPAGENNCTQNNDQEIDLNDRFLIYRYTGQDTVRAYDIGAGSAFDIINSVDFVDWVRIGNTCADFVSLGIRGTTDVLNQYDISSGAPVFFLSVPNVQLTRSFDKCFSSDRVLFTNDTGLSSSVLDRVAIIEPVPIPITVEMDLVIKENGVPIYNDVEVVSVSQALNQFLLSINTGLIYINSGSVYSAHLELNAKRDETIDYNFSYRLDTSGFSLVATKTIPYLATIDIKNFFNGAQEEVLKDVLNMYSLTMQTNEMTKQVFLTPLDDLEKNKALMTDDDDWSDKVDLTRPPTTKYKIGSYAQLNNMIYKSDEDVPVDTGKGSFPIDDFKLPAEKDVIKLFSAASIADLRLLNEHTPTIPFATQPGGYYDSKKFRILLLDPKDKTIDFQNTQTPAVGQTTTDIPFCYFEKDGKNDSLDFTHLIAENYTVLIGMMNQVKALNIDLNLSELDINNLNFLIPKYLDVHNEHFHATGYFYINKIPNFKENVKTKIQLIRL